jgi:hypothetical protein
MASRDIGQLTPLSNYSTHGKLPVDRKQVSDQELQDRLAEAERMGWKAAAAAIKQQLHNRRRADERA